MNPPPNRVTGAILQWTERPTSPIYSGEACRAGGDVVSPATPGIAVGTPMMA